MGEIILKFDTNEESEQAQDAIDGLKWKLTVWRFNQNLRAELKNEHMLEEVREAYENMQGDLMELITENKLYLD